MSDPAAKAYRSKIKTVRQGGADQKEFRPRSRPRRREMKPWTLVYRLIWNVNGGHRLLALLMWHRLGSYKTEAEADKVLAKHLRKHPDFYDIRKFATWDEAKAWMKTENDNIRQMRKT